MKINSELKEKLLRLLDRDTDFRRKVVKIILSDKGGPVTKTYFDRQLEKQSQDLKKYTDERLT